MLELDKCLLAFLVPDKPFVTSEAVIEWQAFVGGSGDEPIECSYPTRKLGRFRTAEICFGLASIPRCVTMYPRNSPEETPNVHFAGFSFMPYLLREFRSNLSSDRGDQQRVAT